ncbi:hypothetical protein GGS21DRAFT_268868 [Xylaria nigripes]|nr:hypothetical protein GGS21DRAFT_268868 [Xylaria nigripes]
MDARNLTAATHKAGAGYDKGAPMNTKSNPPTTGAQADGGNQPHPVFTPSYNTAMTTDGFKNDNVVDDAAQQGDDVTATVTADGTQPVDAQQQQKKKSDKTSRATDWNQADESQKTQQNQGGNKLRGVFGRLKKGSDAAGEEAAQGQGDGEESEAKQKTKGDAALIE